MSISIAFIPVLLVFLAAIIFIVSIGTYVYRDATRRGMNAALWTLVAILAPSLIGFIVYLLVRNNYSDLKCPRCDTSITEEYVICPQCGTKLRPSCPNCATPVEPDWKLCPKCTYPLPGQYENISSPQRPKDKTLRRILIAVVAIPLLLIAMFVILAFLGAASYSSGPAGMTTFSPEELEHMSKDTAVRDWIDSLEEEPDKAYAMEYVCNYEYHYLLYVPGIDYDAPTEFGMVSGFFSANALRLEIFPQESGEGAVYYISGSTENKQELELEVYCNDTELECEVVSVDFDPITCLFDSTVPMY